jgi:hypothetical protein
VPFLFPLHRVECIKDVAAMLIGVFDGTFDPIWANHRQDLFRMLILPCPRVSDDIAPGGSADPLANAKDRVDVGLKVPPAVPTENEFVGVDVDVLVANPVVRSRRPIV